MKKTIHESVLLKESVDSLEIKKEGIYVDCTLGGGGHTLEIAKRLGEKGGGRIVAFDVDQNAIKRFAKFLEEKGWIRRDNLFQKEKVEIVLLNKNFTELKAALKEIEIKKIDGLLADLGLSSDQLEDKARGFSYKEDGPLDMRMDKRLKVTAADLVNGLYKSELEKMFRENDEKFAKRIASALVRERYKKPIKTTQHLIQTIQKALPTRFGNAGNKPSVRAYLQKPVMRVFQALRIRVNSELNSLHKMLPQALETLRAGGKIVIISFHSGEDRIVKNFFKKSEKNGQLEIVTKSPMEPSDDEKKRNPRSSSAKMRIAKKM